MVEATVEILNLLKRSAEPLPDVLLELAQAHSVVDERERIRAERKLAEAAAHKKSRL